MCGEKWDKAPCSIECILSRLLPGEVVRVVVVVVVAPVSEHGEQEKEEGPKLINIQLLAAARACGGVGGHAKGCQRHTTLAGHAQAPSHLHRNGTGSWTL